MSLVTVLMPLYNTEKYLAEAMDSILQQTFTDFDFLIINDGSTDKSRDIALSYTDKRIRYVENGRNIGLVATLNRGIDLIDTKYIIRMDADDLSTLNRFGILVNFMEKHPEVGVFSSALERFGDEIAIWKTPEHNDDIKAHLLFGSSIGHAPCIMRTEILKKNKIHYRDIHMHMEDYDLWFRLKDLADFATTPEVLYKYRVANHNVTVVNQVSVIDRKKKIFEWILGTMGIQPTQEELLLHIGFGKMTLEPTPENINKYRKWLDKLIGVNKKMNTFPHEALVKQINEKWRKAFYLLPSYSYKSITVYKKLSGGLSKAQWEYLLKYTINKYLLRKG